VGRFLTNIWFWIRVPLEFIHFYVKVPKTASVKWPSEERLFQINEFQHYTGGPLCI
jgi:hypothetical protein